MEVTPFLFGAARALVGIGGLMRRWTTAGLALALPLALGAAVGATGCAGSSTSGGAPATAPASGQPGAPAESMPTPKPKGADLTLPGETHLRNVRQVTFGGQNAEAYWSWDDSALSLQVTPASGGCDRINVLDLKAGTLTPIMHSGRQTCAYFLPGDRQILFASTHELSPDCPPEPDRSHGYTWPLYDYDIYVANRDGSDLHNITRTPGYDAEATVRSDGRIVFTSTRSGDIELWAMDPDGGNLAQLTHTVGYDGGAYFSPDGSKLIWRASRPAPGQEEQDYKDLLAQGLVRPTKMELWTANADGSGAYQLTDFGKASFAPYIAPDEKTVVFASNKLDPKGRAFEIWKMNLDGSGLEQVTHDPSGFNAFPMFSRDGKKLVFSSNRNGSVPHETNVFVAEWVP